MPVPDGVKRACRKGIAQVEEGLGGDGLEPATVKEARSLASGDMPTEAKIRKAHRWWARNERFLDAEADTPADVAANLWGGSAGMRWFRGLYDDLDTSEAEATSGKGMKRLDAIFKAGLKAITDNQITVVASTVGNMDRSGDVIAPGAFKSAVLRGFVDNGSILVGHDWDDLPIGMPMDAKVMGDEIVSTAQFHSTPKGQEARTIAMERMEAGKSVSVSVGFMPDYDQVSYYENGATMMKACEEMGMDVSTFDPKIKAYKYGCRLIRSVSELFEWSIVLVGMNPKARAMAVKGLDLQDGDAGFTLENHLSISLAGIERAFDVAKLRKSEGRALSPSRLRIIEDINKLSRELLSFGVAEAKDDDAAKAEMQRRAELLRRVEATLNQL